MGVNAAFYCVADAGYFLGAVATVNSLRAAGHSEPVFVADCGLTEAQRRLLGAEAELVEAPPETPPWLLKTVAPLARPARTMVLIDADMVLNRSLDEPIAAAADGRVVAFQASYHRFVASWGEQLGIGSATERPYLSSALVILGGGPGQTVLRMMDELRDRVLEILATPRAGDTVDDWAFFALDQDLLNAILTSEAIPPEAVDGRDHALVPNLPFAGLELVGGRARYADGREPLALHYLAAPDWPELHDGARKPWQAPLPDSPYTRLLIHHLTADDVAIRIPEGELPVWLRRGPAGSVVRRAVDARGWVGRRLPPVIARRLVARGARSRGGA